MDKRITKIHLNNFKGYFGDYEPISVKNGENVLIYGENGSGKSSLYKAINHFFLSSRDRTIQFSKNRHTIEDEGQIEIEFSDYDIAQSKVIDASQVSYNFTNNISTNQIQFIQDAALTKGFLDYTDLLKIYFHDDPKPNLFELIVLIILGDHIPVSSGGNFKFNERWNQLQQDLVINCFNRNDLIHRRALNFLPVFETHLRSTLDEIFEKTNFYLREYFIDFSIELDYHLLPLNFNYEYFKSDWYTEADLRLKVKKNGLEYNDGYSDFLNEARLSAIAICMYLASLSTTNYNFDVKILYLDDVFIGLDSGNRIPILKILLENFSNYQIFISTYDRHWFELAKRQFEIFSEKPWSFLEIFVGHDFDSNGIKINKPIINKGKTYYERATYYLHHDTQPDYPAAANYFRKALEELLGTELPNYEIVNNDFNRLPEYKLSKFINICHDFLKKINKNTIHIDTINSHLYTLLHPLSHYEITTLIYKRELESVEHSFYKLREQLKNLDLKNVYQCLKGKNSRLRMRFQISTKPLKFFCYEFKLQESLLIFKKNDGTFGLTTSKCNIVKIETIIDSKSTYKRDISKKNTDFHFNSIFDAVRKTNKHIIDVDKQNIPTISKEIEVIEYNDGVEWEPIKKIMIWKNSY